MTRKIYKGILNLLESSKSSLLVFFSSLFIFLSFAGTRLFITDEGVILDQFYNFIHGSIQLEAWKIDTPAGVYLIQDNQVYGKYSYSLLILSLPFYYLFKMIDILYGAHLFILQLWALSGGVVIYLISKIRNIKYPELIGSVSYLILISVNMRLFRPIYFPKWGELLSIEFTNILITSFLVLLVYLLFRDFFGNKIAIFASFFIIFATPISFYATTLKHHSLSLLLTVLAFYFFYNYQEKKDNKYIFAAYILAGLCIWTRILDGIVLIVSLLVIDIIIFKKDARYILRLLIIIIISLLPFFIFNYLVLDNPFAVAEITASDTKSKAIQFGQDAIILSADTINPKLGDLTDKLGYRTNSEIKDSWLSIISSVTFLKINNTFGIFLISPFLVVAFAFIIDRIKLKIKLNTMDIFFMLYAVSLILAYKNYLTSIIIETPVVLEYRYLLVAYIILLYFALRIHKVRDLIERRLKRIILLYFIILMAGIIYLIKEFPMPLMNIYYLLALNLSFFLIIWISIGLIIQSKVPGLSDNITTFAISLSLAQASIFLIFYYWFESITYVSPSQNHPLLPLMGIILKWTYSMI